jgi:hypothetical protein
MTNEAYRAAVNAIQSKLITLGDAGILEVKTPEATRQWRMVCVSSNITLMICPEPWTVVYHYAELISENATYAIIDKGNQKKIPYRELLPPIQSADENVTS